jgi:signal peptidase I
MEPGLRDGDLVVTSAPRKALRPGEVIVYKERRSNFYVAHRVEALGCPGVLTRGDANIDFDPLPVESGQIAGRVRMTIPWLGRFIALLRSEAFE